MDNLRCPWCDYHNLENANFCAGCGKKLKSGEVETEPPPSHSISIEEGERRIVTILFAKLTRMREVASIFSLEEQLELIESCFKKLEEVVHSFGGTIDKFIRNNRVMVLFGAPYAHDDDPTRAVYSAIEMQKVVDRWNEKINKRVPEGIGLKIGVNTGLVYFGKLGETFTVIGDAVNLASRIEEISIEGQVLLGDRTRSLASREFDFEELLPQKVRGKEELISIFHLLGHKEAKVELLPFVGREEELAFLESLFKQVCSGSCKVVGVVGDGGVGKSRLKTEFKNRIVEMANVGAYEGECYSPGTSKQYKVFLDILGSMLDVGSGSDEERGKIISEKLLGLDEELGFGIPIIQYLFSVKSAEKLLSSLDPQQRKNQLFVVIKNILSSMSMKRLIVMIFETFEGIDKSSYELLDYLTSELKSYPIFFLLTSRRRFKEEISKLENFVIIELNGLSKKESEELILEGIKDVELPFKLMNAIVEKSNGNPLFIEEFLKNIRGKDIAHFSSLEIPDSIYGVVMERLDELGSELKKSLQYASVLGRDFSPTVLSRIMEKEVDEDLIRLDDLGFIIEGDGGYSFMHPSVQEIAYDTLLLKRKKELHNRTGEVLETIYRENLGDYYELLAHHYYRGENFKKATEYMILSGGKLKSLYANLGALTYYEQAEESLTKIGGDMEKETEILVKKAEIYELTGDYKEAVLANEGALVRYRENNNSEGEAKCVERVGMINIRLGNYEDAIEKFNESLEIDRKYGHRLGEANVLSGLGLVYNVSGNFFQSLLYYNQSFNILKGLDDKQGQINAVKNIGMLQEQTGNYEASLEYYTYGLDLAKEIKNVRYETELKSVLGSLYRSIGNYEGAIELLTDAQNMASKIGDRLLQIRAKADTGIVNLSLKKYEEAERDLLIALEQVKEIWSKGAECYILAWLGVLYYKMDKQKESEDFCMRSLDIAKKIGSKRFETIILMVLSGLKREKGVKYAEDALSLANSVGSPSLVWKSYAALGKVYFANGKIDKAKEMLGKAVFIIDDLKERITDKDVLNYFTSSEEIKEVYSLYKNKDAMP